MARKKIAVKPEPVIYPMSKQVSFWMWLFFILALIPFPYMAYIRFEDGETWGSALPLVAAMVFLYAARTFEKLRHAKIELSPAGIARVERDGTRIFLKWTETTLSQEAQSGRGLVLSNRDENRELLIDSLLKDYANLLEKVFENLRKRMEAPRLPLVFSKTFRSILVEEKGITCRGFFKTYFLPWDGMERVDWGYFYLPWFASRNLFIKLIMKSGYTIRVRPGVSVVGEMYLILKKSFGKFGRPKRSNKAEEAVAAKKRKRDWLRSFAAGALLITFPGWFLGKIVYRMMDESGFWDVLGLVLVFAAVFLFLCLLFRKEARVLPAPDTEEVPSKFNVFATNLSFLIAGFFLTGYFWWFTGKIALDHVKAEVVKAGYSVKMPENAPKLPDTKNAVYYIKKAAKVPSAESLLYEDYKDKKPAYDKPFFGKSNESTFLSQFCRDMRLGKLTKEQIASAIKLIKGHEENFRLLDKAYEVKGVDWGIDFQAKYGMIESPSIGYTITLARLLACRSYLQAKEGKDQEAIKSLQEGFFLADVMGETKTIMSNVLEDVVLRIALYAVPDVLLRVDARDMKSKFVPVISERSKNALLLKGLEFDFFARLRWMETVGWIEFARYYRENIQFCCDGGIMQSIEGFFYRPFLRFDLAAGYESNLRKITACRLPYPRIGEVWAKAERDNESKGWFLGRLMSMRFNTFYLKSLETVADCRVTRAAVESRIFFWQNKRWPKSAKELAGKGEPFLDPFTDGEDLRLVPQKDGVLIYSIGPDGKDDAGMPQIYNMSSGDIGWLVKLPVLTAQVVPAKPATDEIPAP